MGLPKIVTHPLASIRTQGDSTPGSHGWHCPEGVQSARALLHIAPFVVRHPWADEPAFKLEALGAVMERASKRPSDYYYDAGDIKVTDSWGSRESPGLSPKQILDNIETAGVWCIMKHVEQDAPYDRLLNEWAAFVRALAGPLGGRRLLRPEMLVLVTSPGRTTPFHFDAEVNFLVQLRGTKEVWVCNPLDRLVTTEAELEKYYAVTSTAGVYSELAKQRGQRFVLGPGDALHIPTHAAHWVHNYDNVSVSLSMNFELPWLAHRARYQGNHMLRELGFQPPPVGRNVLRDQLTGVTMGSAFRAQRLVRAQVKNVAKRLKAIRD